MYDFYLFSLIASIALLVIWQTFSTVKSLNRLFGTLFLMAIIAYAISLFEMHLRDFYSLKIVFRDLMIMSLISFLSFIARKSYFIKFVWLCVAGFFIYVLSNHREVLIPKDFSLDKDAELFIKLDDGDISDDQELLAFLNKNNIQYAKAFSPEYSERTELDDYYTLDLDRNDAIFVEDIKRKLINFSGIEVLEENEEIYLSPVLEEINPHTELEYNFNDPLNKDQWALKVLKLESLMSLIEDVPSVTKKARLFILDTGIDANHEDIRDNYLSINPKYDKDVQNHGTHCAGIAGAITNNGKGVSSMALNNNLFTITSVKVLSDLGIGNQKTILNGIIEAAENGADVISLSLGGRSTDKRQKLYEEAVAYANSLGAIVVVAAGNSNMNAKDYSPANTKGVIAVAAIDEQLNMAGFSNSVEDLEMGIAAPGVNILSTISGDEYKAFNGTSMATPYVAGLVAIMKSINPSLSTHEVFDLINANGQTLTQNKSGNLIDPYNTLKNLMGR